MIIFTYIWVIIGVNVGKYSIHGASGLALLFGCRFSEETLDLAGKYVSKVGLSSPILDLDPLPIILDGPSMRKANIN